MGKKAVLAVLVVVAVVLGVRAYLQTRAFQEATEHYHAGDNYLSNGGSGAALAEFQKALDVCPDHAGAWAGLIDCQLEMKQFAEARASCDKALLVLPNNSELYKLKATACSRLGDKPQAIACLEKAATLSPDDPLIANLLKRAKQAPTASPSPMR